jgi:peptidoglycan/xylan/chitin deacetylase (PgdA/CDA1 family)
MRRSAKAPGRGGKAVPAVHAPGSEAFDPTYFLHERYARRDAGQSRLLAAYYSLKPLVPRPLQLAIRRLYARRQARRAFPAWPIEPILVEHQYERLRHRLRESGGEAIPLVNFWPRAKRFCVIISHDVEGLAGIENIPRVLEVERRHGFVSAWNFVAEWYEIPNGLFDAIRGAGCEIGLHGIKHDGKLFRDRAHFEADLPKIHRYLREWGAVGFRSPATHRNAEWMPELGSLYDGSFPDTDPFEPQSGGCCSIFPFFLGDLVELPITLVQDHTLFEILGDGSISLWTEKSEWIMQHHGLVHLLVHPDYLLTDDRLAAYEQFLQFMSGREDAWHALPRDVARWWKTRADLRCEPGDGGVFQMVGGPLEGATVTLAREEDGRIVLGLGERAPEAPASPHEATAS